MTVTVETKCADQEAECVCDEPFGHNGTVHTCECGGAWDRVTEPPEIVAWPGSAPGYTSPFPAGLLERLGALR